MGITKEQHTTLMIQIVRACHEEGVNPGYHRRMKCYLRAEWPMLARELDQLEALVYS